MITNQQPWQAIVNTALLTKVSKTNNPLLIVNNDFSFAKQKPATAIIKFIAARRYSFDDNGGGYNGL